MLTASVDLKICGGWGWRPRGRNLCYVRIRENGRKVKLSLVGSKYKKIQSYQVSCYARSKLLVLNPANYNVFSRLVGPWKRQSYTYFEPQLVKLPMFKRPRKKKRVLPLPLQFDLFDMKSLGSNFVNEVFTVFKIPGLQSRRSFISLKWNGWKKWTSQLQVLAILKLLKISYSFFM